MESKRVIIGVSKLSPNYAVWLNKLHLDPVIIDFYQMPIEEALNQALAVGGILLTGGSDIHPGLYDRGEDLPYCRDIDSKRDELEMKIIGLGLKFNIPMLGICRGQQILNVYMKGTLYADIPESASKTVLHASDKDVYHPVTIGRDSQLFRLSGVTQEIVNSSHHQAVNSLAKGLRATAFSPDGLIEAIEPIKVDDHAFLMAVQWHPERMNFDNPLSGLLGRGFIEAAQER